MGKKSKAPAASTTASLADSKKTKTDTTVKAAGVDKKGKKAAVFVAQDINVAGPSSEPVASNTTDEDETEDEDEEDGESGSELEEEAGSDHDDEWEDDEDTEDEDDDGVDEEGMERLMRALGDDGLNDYDKAQLESLVDGDDNEESESRDGSVDQEGVSEPGDSEEEEGQDGREDDKEDEEQDEIEEEAVALDDVEGVVDEDTVPQQKIEIDNTVRLLLNYHALSYPVRLIFFFSHRRLWSVFARPFNLTRRYHGQRLLLSRTTNPLMLT
jgi:rRNA-processing protein EBP2